MVGASQAIVSYFCDTTISAQFGSALIGFGRRSSEIDRRRSGPVRSFASSPYSSSSSFVSTLMEKLKGQV